MVVPTSPLPIPPVSPYGTPHGALFQYSGNNLIAFESPSPSLSETYFSPTKCILIGGLSDGLLPTPYTQALQDACNDSGWTLVQPLLSSSYTGFGHGSLDRDSCELDALLTYLNAHRNADRFAIVGHSTGCQNAIHYLKHGNPDLVKQIKLVALQAPVSDREHAMTEDNYHVNIQHAQKLVDDGKENEMMPRSAFWAPITAKRFLDLQSKGGADDFFSSDFTNDELAEKLGHVGKLESTLQVLVAFSGSDEYVPSHVDSKQLTQRLCQAMNTECQDGESVAQPLYLSNANHNLSESQGDSQVFVDKVSELLEEHSVRLSF